MTSHPYARIVTVAALSFLAGASAAGAQETGGYASTGVYVGVASVPNFTLDGVTFDGSTYYRQIDGDEIMILPRLDSRSTLRGVAGYRSARGSFEVSYERTKHTGTFLGASGEASFQSLNFDERIYAMTRGRIQPYGLLGLSIPSLTVKEGSGDGERIGDAHWHGFGLNIEPGVAVYPTPHVGISVGYRYRVMWFDTAVGVTDTTYQLRPRFRETAGSASITAFVTF